MPTLLLLSDENRILRKRIILPSNLRVCFPRGRKNPTSGASIARQAADGRRASQTEKEEVLNDYDDADSIATGHLRYLGNGVWISKGMSRAIV